MSKEIKVSDVFNLPVYGACVHVNFVKLKEEYNDGVTPFDLIDTAINDHERLTEENTALREALRLKEAECEALAHDKSVLLSFVKRVSELDIENWNYETDDGDPMCFEFIGGTEIASDAAGIIEYIEGAGNNPDQHQPKQAR